ncbi:MAG: UDP-N-acetylmuramoyl-L-alanine--D-glutamate ligase [Simkaniaceae bacterium]
MKRVIFGLGLSGLAALELLKRESGELFAVDRKPISVEGVSVYKEEAFPTNISIDEVIVSPGVSFSNPLIQRFLKRGIPVIGEMEMALGRVHQPCIGITGTNGKTTTTYRITHLLNQAGQKACALGNCGIPLSSYLLNPDLTETLCLEMSSFQLETIQSKKLERALLLPITEDHLDRYRSFEDYAKTKCRIVKALQEGGKLLLLEETKKKFEKYLNEVESISIRGGVEDLVNKLFESLHIEVSEEMKKSFQSPKHRLEEVGTFKGVRVINDSKATNIDSVLYAVHSLPKNLSIILGGRDKGGDFTKLVDLFRRRVKKAYLYGEASVKIKKELNGIPLEMGSFEEMVNLAFKETKSGEILLLSPACASFDSFRNFEERGDLFKKIVKQSVMPS